MFFKFIIDIAFDKFSIYYVQRYEKMDNRFSFSDVLYPIEFSTKNTAARRMN